MCAMKTAAQAGPKLTRCTIFRRNGTVHYCGTILWYHLGFEGKGALALYICTLSYPQRQLQRSQLGYTSTTSHAVGDLKWPLTLSRVTQIEEAI